MRPAARPTFMRGADKIDAKSADVKKQPVIAAKKPATAAAAKNPMTAAGAAQREMNIHFATSTPVYLVAAEQVEAAPPVIPIKPIMLAAERYAQRVKEEYERQIGWLHDVQTTIESHLATSQRANAGCAHKAFAEKLGKAYANAGYRVALQRLPAEPCILERYAIHVVFGDSRIPGIESEPGVLRETEGGWYITADAN